MSISFICRLKQLKLKFGHLGYCKGIFSKSLFFFFLIHLLTTVYFAELTLSIDLEII